MTRLTLTRRVTLLVTVVALLAVLLTSALTFRAGVQAIEQVAVQAQGGPPVPPAAPVAPVAPRPPAAPGVDRSPAEEAFRTRVVQAALLSAALAVLAGALFSGTLTRPLRHLALAARRFAAGDRDVTLPVPRAHDELRELTVSFNTLSATVQQQERWRRALVADVAHDLRTPLAVLRAEIEAMQDGVSEPDGPGLDRLHGQVTLLSRLVGDLKVLSLAEGGALSLHLQTVVVRGALSAACAAYAARAAAEGVDLRLDVPDGDWAVRADPDRLAQVLHNLLDNALRYAGARTVTLGGHREGHEGVLWVHDDGRGLTEQALENVFERFWREDTARGRTGTSGGSGLGLSIVRALVEAQGGHVRAANHPHGGAVFTLHLPLA